MSEVVIPVNGRYDAATGTVRGFLPQDSIGRRITNITIQGPARSTFRGYRGGVANTVNQCFSTPTGGGGDNQYDSTTDGAPIPVPAATDLLVVWSGGSTTAGSTGTATFTLVY